MIDKRTALMQQLQLQTINGLDQQISTWINISRYLAWQTSEHPSEVQVLLRQFMALNPEIVQIELSSKTLNEKLISRSISYPQLAPLNPDLYWIPIANDSSICFSTSRDSSSNLLLFLLQKKFHSGSIPLTLVVACDASPLQSVLASIPFGSEYAAIIRNDSVVFFQNAAYALPFQKNAPSNVAQLKFDRIRSEEWGILSSEMKSIPLSLVIAVPQHVILQPVNSLLIYSIGILGIFTSIIFILAWFISRQIAKPVSILVADVERLSGLDFTQPIKALPLPEIEQIARTIEGMRKILERYQRINVEKIIFEEWKNRFLMSHSESMIGITGSDGNFLFVNDQLQKFLGELQIPEDQRKKEILLSSPKITMIRGAVRTESEGDFMVHFSQMELRVAVREDVCQYFRLQDVSIKRQEENLGSLILFYDLTTERQIDQMRTDMINVVVHELRTPLQSFVGFTSILLEDSTIPAKDQRQYLNLMMQSADTLTNLINRFLDIQRLESRKIDHPKSKTDLIAIIRNLIDLLQPQLQAKLLAVNFDFDPSRSDIEVSPELIREAFLNLLSNAIKYGDPSRTIEISLRADSSAYHFTIIDHGYGISAEDQKKLYTKFYRVRSNRKAAAQVGTGLGLAYVKEIVSYHGGTIHLESDSTIGCKFTITLPFSARESE